jgi:hypothetical protein
LIESGGLHALLNYRCCVVVVEGAGERSAAKIEVDSYLTTVRRDHRTTVVSVDLSESRKPSTPTIDRHIKVVEKRKNSHLRCLEEQTLVSVMHISSFSALVLFSLFFLFVFFFRTCHHFFDHFMIGIRWEWNASSSENLKATNTE